jgi:hypothetical protein
MVRAMPARRKLRWSGRRKRLRWNSATRTFDLTTDPLSPSRQRVERWVGLVAGVGFTAVSAVSLALGKPDTVFWVLFLVIGLGHLASALSHDDERASG